MWNAFGRNCNSFRSLPFQEHEDGSRSYHTQVWHLYFHTARGEAKGITQANWFRVSPIQKTGIFDHATPSSLWLRNSFMDWTSSQESSTTRSSVRVFVLTLFTVQMERSLSPRLTLQKCHPTPTCLRTVLSSRCTVLSSTSARRPTW